jgi:hypothetical protein
MATAISEDFVTKNGIVIQGTSVVTSSTSQSNALQVGGGAAIAANLIVGTTATIGNKLTVGNDTYINGKVTATGVVSITNSTAATTASTGALVVNGGIYAGGNVVISNANASTATITSNALYVEGGAAFNKSIWVVGPARFDNDVVFSGATTYVYSTNTVYTDNLIELHTPSNSTEWAVDDGKDIGLRFHYYSTTGTNAALVLANDTKYLEWYGSGAESNTGTFGGAVYGTFKTGYVKLTSTDTAISTITGALQTVGGAGIGGTIYAGGDISGASLTGRNLTQGRIPLVGLNGQLTDDATLTYNTTTNYITAKIEYANTATNLKFGARGSLIYQSSTGTTDYLSIGNAGYVLLSANGLPEWSTFAGVTSGRATTASNIAFGADMQIPFQNGVGSTAFDQNLRYEYNSFTFRSVNAIFTGTTAATNTSTGALQVVGGLGVGQDVYIGGNEYIFGDIAVLGGDITTNQSTFNLLNTTATTINFAGSGTAITIGSNTGYTAIRNQTTITNTTAATSTSTGALQVYGGVGIGQDLYISGNEYIFGDIAVLGGDITTNQSTFNLLNSTATTVNFAGSGTAITIGTNTGYTAIRNQTTVTNTAAATSTSTGALRVYGGVGIGGDIYVGGTVNISNDEIITGNLAVNGGNITTNQTTFNLLNTTATTVNFAGSGTAITIGSSSGYTKINSSVNATTTTSGALQVIGGVGIGQDLFVGGNETILGDLEVRGGDITTNQTTFNLLNATASTINFGGAGTAITIGTTTGYTAIRNQTTVTNTTAATSTSTGALQVRGGVGIGGNLYISGTTVAAALTATNTTVTNLTVNGTASVAGIASFTEGSNATLVGNGAVKVTGGVSISRDVVVGGQITAGTTLAATTGTSVPALYSNNTLLASFTSNVLTGTAQVSLDTFSSTAYRSARYFVQIVDGGNIQLSELSVFHNGASAYLSEYGISTNNGQLGIFDATWDASNVTIKFTPTNATSMVIKMVRTTITL